MSEFFELIYLLIIIFFIAILIVGIYFFIKSMNKQKRLIEQQAYKRNGTIKQRMSYPELEFPHLHYTVQVYSHPGSRYSSPETWVEVKLNNPSIDKFTVYRERLTSKIGKTLGMQDIQIGSSDFDNQFMIKGTDEYFTTQVLSFNVQNKLLEIKYLNPFVRLKENVLHLWIYKIPKTEIVYDQIIETILAIMDRMRKLSRL